MMRSRLQRIYCFVAAKPPRVGDTILSYVKNHIVARARASIHNRSNIVLHGREHAVEHLCFLIGLGVCVQPPPSPSSCVAVEQTGPVCVCVLYTHVQTLYTVH